MASKFNSFFSQKSSTPVSSAKLFAIKEAYKTIRTNILLNLEDKPCHILSITSSLPGEGKSTSSINLAISIAQFDKKVLMIDADLRKKKASKYLKYNSTKGLTDLVKGEVKFEDVVNVTKYPNFDFISSGTYANNPSEILASRSMKTLLDELSKKYDFILIDTPPVNIVSDALPLIRISDGVVLVVREMVATYKDFKKLLSNLGLIKANILGIIYIGTDETTPYYHSANYGHKYNKYSSYYSE
ncbi:MAG: CpsD/CapB family tyrosine-protein kinase [Ruminococcaceae bacterium]|nr:CpsD/CapB family tyrosine-protein kinase [Oscillospiraceae bacterium]